MHSHGTFEKATIKMYWRQYFLDALLQKHYARDRFLQIMNYFHICDNDTADADDRLTKIRTSLDLIVEKFKTNYTPTQDISTDESFLKFKGRLKFNITLKRGQDLG